MLVKISIIIPVYNVEKYISYCLESILSQTFKNFEVIVINDGSIDKSLDICLDYEKKDNRIKVFSQKNQGQGKARNFGVSKATGDYLMFVDSDDYLNDEFCLSKIIEKIDDNTEIVLYGLKRNALANKYAKERLACFLNLPRDIASGEKYILEMIKANPYYPWGPCNMVCSMRYWKENNFSFCEGVFYEDLMLMWKVICRARHLSIVRDIIYIYRVDQEKSTTKDFSEFSIKCHIDALNQNAEELNAEDFSENLKAAIMRTFAADFFNLLLMLQTKSVKNSKEINKMLEKSFNIFSGAQKTPKHFVVFVLIKIFGFDIGIEIVRAIKTAKNKK